MKPPYYIVTATCRYIGCANNGKEYSKQRKTATYQATDGSTKQVENLVCPKCRTWGLVIRIEGVTG